MRAKLKEIKEGMRKRVHEPPSRQGSNGLARWSKAGSNYHAVPPPTFACSVRSASMFVDLWQRSLRRLQPGSTSDTMAREKDRKLSRVNGCLLPRSSIQYWPSDPLPRQTPEVGAVCGNPCPYGSERGRVQQWTSLPRSNSLTSAVPAPTRLTGSSLPFLGGSSADVSDS